MDKFEARVRVFECLCNNQINHMIASNKQLDQLVYKAIEIAEKFNEVEKKIV